MIPNLEITPLCISCDICRILCPENAIIKINQTYTIETWSCTLCQACTEVCPLNCIKLVENS